MNLPKMTVEKRVSTKNHGIPAPDLSILDKELQYAIQMNQDVHTSAWEDSTLEIISMYLDESPEDFEMVDSVNSVMGHKTWKDVSVFVVDDMCADFFNRALQYCLKEGQAHKKKKGFIDGSGIGYLHQYYRDLKVSLEKAFDVKYYYKLERPLEYALNKGFDLSRVANAIHPGHWSYPAGHGTKFYQAVYTLEKVFALDKKCKRTLLIAAGVEAQGRSGNLIHYPMDNCIGRLLTEKEN